VFLWRHIVTLLFHTFYVEICASGGSVELSNFYRVVFIAKNFLLKMCLRVGYAGLGSSWDSYCSLCIASSAEMIAVDALHVEPIRLCRLCKGGDILVAQADVTHSSGGSVHGSGAGCLCGAEQTCQSPEAVKR
jgi:hypothetical protein